MKHFPVRFQHLRDTYKVFTLNNEVFLDGEIIVVTECPWYKGWLGLKPTRLKVGDGKTPFRKLKFI